jgi:hypothetical protein
MVAEGLATDLETARAIVRNPGSQPFAEKDAFGRTVVGPPDGIEFF